VRHVIIVTRIADKLVGLLVDAVLDILTIAKSALQPTPDVACDLARTFVKGLLAVEGRMISLISLDRVLPSSERLA
jgi:purine-binding chemotaxis protein CheW